MTPEDQKRWTKRWQALKCEPIPEIAEVFKIETWGSLRWDLPLTRAAMTVIAEYEFGLELSFFYLDPPETGWVAFVTGDTERLISPEPTIVDAALALLERCLA